jgi:hypothetical protein
MLIKDENFNIENNNIKKRKKYYNYEAKIAPIEDDYTINKTEPNIILEDTFIKKRKKIYNAPIFYNCGLFAIIASFFIMINYNFIINYLNKNLIFLIFCFYYYNEEFNNTKI